MIRVPLDAAGCPIQSLLPSNPCRRSSSPTRHSSGTQPTIPGLTGVKRRSWPGFPGADASTETEAPRAADGLLFGDNQRWR